MRRFGWPILLAVLVSACAGPSRMADPSPATVPAPSQATAVLAVRPGATDLPTAAARPAAPAAPAPTALVPTSAPTPPTAAPPAITIEPTTAPVPANTPLPAGRLPTAPLDPQDQAKALLPEFQSDLAGAGQWNRYTISATIDPQARTIAGRQRVEYTNRDTVALDRLYFHLYPNLPAFGGRLDVAALVVDGQPAPVVYEDRRFLLRVDLPRPLAPGATSVVTFDFSTHAPANASAELYGAFNLEKGVLALASSYPIAAIVRDGRWDLTRPDPRGDFVNSETALYDVTLTAPGDWTLATTGVALSERIDSGRRVARFVSGPQRDFMISAVQLAQISTDVDGTHITSYYRPGDDVGGQLALQTAANALRAFNARYGRYPLAELDVVEVAATTFLGVEYPGLIMIEGNLYHRPEGLESTVAHEVGHQWWYSLVGNDVQTEAWLDEALASYSQIVYKEFVYGPAAAERELDGFRRRYQDALAAGRDAPVSQPTAAFRGNYVTLVYGKAVLFFQALREQIGEAAFDQFLHTYYATHRYGFVTGADLLASAEGACACQLDGLYQDWITTVAPVEMP